MLSDREIAKSIAGGDIVVSPLLDARSQLGSASLDIRLGTHFKALRSTALAHIDPVMPEGMTEAATDQLDESAIAAMGERLLRRQVTKYSRDEHVRLWEPFVLHPNEFVLGASMEFVSLSSRIAGRLEGRSSWGRLGLQIHATAGFVDPGYSGILTFELLNIGRIPVSVYPGMRIGQLSFFGCDECCVPYSKKKGQKYHLSLEPSIKIWWSEADFRTIAQIVRTRGPQ
jgi:dCTP deaminase